MIQGLKIQIAGPELQELCLNRAAYHRDRADKYVAQINRMEEQKIEGMNYTAGDPINALRDKRNSHIQDAEEMEFLAKHIVTMETYHLDRDDLRRLGIVRSQY